MWLFVILLRAIIFVLINLIATNYLIEECQYSFKYNFNFNKENLFVQTKL